jgi:hypothetical protein
VKRRLLSLLFRFAGLPPEQDFAKMEGCANRIIIRQYETAA